jgi:hypothetical protein
VAHCCKSAVENDCQADKFFLADLLRGCGGGRCGGDLELESSLELLMPSELLMVTAKANVLRLELSGLFDIPPI